jgi:hypothetical protein
MIVAVCWAWVLLSLVLVDLTSECCNFGLEFCVLGHVW